MGSLKQWILEDKFYIVVVLFAVLVLSVAVVSFTGGGIFASLGIGSSNGPHGLLSESSKTLGTGSAVGEKAVFAEPASEEELFEMVSCPCCGSPISKGCCGGAIVRQKHIRQLIGEGASKEAILLSVAKEFGMDNIIDESVQEGIRISLAENAPSNRPIIALEPSSLDLGDVSFAKGEVFTSFTVKNDGQTDLIVTGMESSCGCTTATLIVGSVESPRFGMPGHGLEMPKDWSASIAPGETGELRVYYDPTVHPDLRGSVTRTVSVFSNDPVNFGAKVRIEANQVD